MRTEAEKREIKLRLAEACLKVGIPITDVMGSPLQVAIGNDPTRTTREHLEVIDNALSETIATPNAKLMVFAPPQSGKSELVSRWFPFWWLTQKPQDRIILASYAKTLAMGHSAACRDFIMQHGAAYGLRLRPDEASKSDWTITLGGGIRSRGVRAGSTGFPSDLTIVDDPYRDRAEADSPKIRNGVWDWYSSAVVTRLAPEARTVITLTRWHQDDLAGELLKREGRIEEGGEWRVITLPAIAQTPNLEKKIYPDSLGREPGEPLSHPRIPADDRDALLKHWEGRRRALTNRDWNALCQCAPVDSEGALLTSTAIFDATAEPPEKWKRRGVGVDPGGGGRDSVGIIGGGLDYDGRSWWTHDRTAKLRSDKWPQTACKLAFEIDATEIVVEKNFGGDMGRNLISQAWQQLQRDNVIPQTLLCPLVREVVARKSKILRAEPIAQAVLTGRQWFAPGLTTLETEWQQWEPGSEWSPGALDAGVHLATELLPTIPRGARTTNPAKKRKSEARATGIAARRRTA
jgi:hypothetical protein